MAHLPSRAYPDQWYRDVIDASRYAIDSYLQGLEEADFPDRNYEDSPNFKMADENHQPVFLLTGTALTALALRVARRAIQVNNTPGGYAGFKLAFQSLQRYTKEWHIYPRTPNDVLPPKRRVDVSSQAELGGIDTWSQTEGPALISRKTQCTPQVHDKITATEPRLQCDQQTTMGSTVRVVTRAQSPVSPPQSHQSTSTDSTTCTDRSTSPTRPRKKRRRPPPHVRRQQRVVDSAENPPPAPPPHEGSDPVKTDRRPRRNYSNRTGTRNHDPPPAWDWLMELWEAWNWHFCRSLAGLYDLPRRRPRRQRTRLRDRPPPGQHPQF